MQAVVQLELSSVTEQGLAELVNMALEEEDKLLNQYLGRAENKKPRIKGNPYFRHYWKKSIRDLRIGNQ